MELIQEILSNPPTGALETDRSGRSDDPDAPQRRSEPRFPTNRLTAIYSTGSEGPERMFCTILDVSRHGMRVRTARPLRTGAQVRVTLREVSVIGTVCYCNRVDGGFDHGLEIQELEKHSLKERTAPSRRTHQ